MYAKLWKQYKEYERNMYFYNTLNKVRVGEISQVNHKPLGKLKKFNHRNDEHG